MVVFLLAACGPSAANFGMDYADAGCDFTEACPGNGGYYENHQECVDQLIDEMSADTHVGCDYDRGLANECLELIRDATDTCDVVAAFNAVHGTCADVWSC